MQSKLKSPGPLPARLPGDYWSLTKLEPKAAGPGTVSHMAKAGLFRVHQSQGTQASTQMALVEGLGAPLHLSGHAQEANMTKVLEAMSSFLDEWKVTRLMPKECPVGARSFVNQRDGKHQCCQTIQPRDALSANAAHVALQPKVSGAK